MPKTPTPVEIRREFKTRAINAWEAFRCCVKSRNEVSRMLDFIADGIEFGKRVPEGQCALVAPGSTTIPRLDEVCIPKRQPTPVPGGGDPRIIIIGIVVAIAEAVTVEIETTTQAQEMLQESLRKVASEVRTKTARTCYDCIKKHLWGQAARRKTYRGAEAKDGSIERYLRLRMGRLH